jgi:hypothetical protein
MNIIRTKKDQITKSILGVNKTDSEAYVTNAKGFFIP